MSLGAADLSPAFLNTGTTDEKFQQSEQQGSFRDILKSLASMHESSGSRFFRATTGFKCWAPTTVRPHSETTVNSIIQ